MVLNNFSQNEKFVAVLLSIGLVISFVVVIDNFSLSTVSSENPASAEVISVEEFEQNETGIGLDVDSTLDFGRMPEGSAARKNMTLESNKLSFYSVRVEGNISESLDHTGNGYFDGSTELEFEFNADETGYYEGTVILKVDSPNNDIGLKWLGLRSKL